MIRSLKSLEPIPSPYLTQDGCLTESAKRGKAVFDGKAGLTWLDSASRVFTLSLEDLEAWYGLRAQAGKVVPKGFPRSNRFGPAFG